jgi:hypothetical protein
MNIDVLLMFWLNLIKISKSSSCFAVRYIEVHYFGCTVLIPFGLLNSKPWSKLWAFSLFVVPSAQFFLTFCYIYILPVWCYFQFFIKGMNWEKFDSYFVIIATVIYSVNAFSLGFAKNLLFCFSLFLLPRTSWEFVGSFGSGPSWLWVLKVFFFIAKKEKINIKDLG